ncbi:MAG: hypothetical protein MJ060_01545 [Clostridia bacterium]|nr:hypothetical protein [Clostridia bacterium]
MPDSWKELAKGKTYAQADCSAELIEIAGDVFQFVLSDKRKKPHVKLF